MNPGVVYVVATPIGHLGDLSARALEVLRSVDVVASEDTRRTRVLLTRYGIHARLVAYHAHNEAQVAATLIAQIQMGRSVALVSDAGTPCLSDPGQQLVDACHAHGVRLVPIPGASAVTSALSVAGLDNSRFMFEGFIPRDGRARRDLIASWRTAAHAVVLFEAPSRVFATLAELQEALGGDRVVLVARELTKIHEQLVRGSLATICKQISEGSIPALGEFVLVIAPVPRFEQAVPTQLDPEQVMRHCLEYLSPSQASRLAARLTGLSRGELDEIGLRVGAGERDPSPAE